MKFIATQTKLLRHHYHINKEKLPKRLPGERYISKEDFNKRALLFLSVLQIIAIRIVCTHTTTNEQSYSTFPLHIKS